MKKTFILSCLFLIIAACSESEQKTVATVDENGTCDCNDLAYDQAYNNFYEDEPRDGYTGNCKEYYANGELKLDKNFKEGKVHGDFTTYHENGLVSSRKVFDGGFQTDEQVDYSETGQIVFHALYERGNQLEIIVRGPDQEEMSF